MNRIKKFDLFVSESLFNFALLGAYGSGDRYKPLPDIEYQGFFIPSWKNTYTNEIWYGTPRPKWVPKKRLQEYFLYKENRLDELKKVIDDLVNGSLISRPNPVSQSQANLPDYTKIFPKWDKKESSSEFQFDRS